jgi:hypothetical protein
MDVLSNGIGKWEYYRLLKMFVGMPSWEHCLVTRSNRATKFVSFTPLRDAQPDREVLTI